MLRQEPLPRLVDTPEQLVAELDDLAEARWRASRQVRAAMVMTALKRRWRGELELPDRLPEFDPNTAYPEPVPPRQLPKFEMVAAD